jgi:hypothetical protein
VNVATFSSARGCGNCIVDLFSDQMVAKRQHEIAHAPNDKNWRQHSGHEAHRIAKRDGASLPMPQPFERGAKEVIGGAFASTVDELRSDGLERVGFPELPRLER